MAVQSTSLRVPVRNFQRLLPLTIAMLCAHTAMAQNANDPPVTATDRTATLDKVVVTGSNIRTTTAAEEGPAPVAVISQEDLQLLGYKDIKDVLRFDAAFTGWSETEGLDYSTRSTVNMRGLGSQYTLVLLNGRRFSAEQAADISLIPISAVDRIEILKDGASALYGSDAVGGVVNIITRTKFDGVEVEAYYGNTTDTDTSNNQLRLVFGGGDEKMKFLGSLAYTKRNDMYSEDRDITRSQDMRSWGGYDQRSGNTNPAAFFVEGRGWLRLDNSRFSVGQYSTNPDDYIAYVPDTDKWSRPHRSVVLPLERTNFFGSVVAKPFDNDVELFGEILYSDSKSETTGGSSAISLADPELGPVPATNPYNPFGVEISRLSYRAYEPAVGLYYFRMFHETQASRLVGGIRGWVGDWNYEAAASYFTEEENLRAPNYFSKSGFRSALYRPGADAFNPFCFGCNTPEQMAGVLYELQQNTKYVSKTMDARASGPLMDNWAGSIGAAVGVEYREESYLYRPDAMFTSGDILDVGVVPIEGNKRDVKALFAEVNIPLVGASDNSKGAPVLDLNLAARSEKYSDFGSTTNPKASLRWQLPTTMPIVARASYGSSFKAPQLSQILESGIRIGEDTLLDPLTGLEVEAVIVGGTNPALRPEEANYSNIGLVISPLDNDRDRVTIAVDYFRVRQQDVIIQPTAQDVLNGVSPGGVDRTPGAAQQRYGKDGDLLIFAGLVNGGDRATNGVDFNTSWERKSDEWGNFTVTFSASRLLKRTVDIGDGRGDIDYAGFTPFPKNRGNLMVDWERNAWRLGMVNRYIGGFDGVAPGDDPAPVGSYTLTSVSLQYDTSRSESQWLWESAWTRNTTIKFGIDNLMDRDPVFVYYLNGYNPSLSDIMGRSYYVSIKRKL